MSQDCSHLPSLGSASNLRPNPSDGWHCVFTSGVLAQADTGRKVAIEREGFRYFTAAGKTFPWQQLATPQQLADKIRAQGGIPLWIEAWENPPSNSVPFVGPVGNDDFIFIAMYA